MISIKKRRDVEMDGSGCLLLFDLLRWVGSSQRKAEKIEYEDKRRSKAEQMRIREQLSKKVHDGRQSDNLTQE